MESFRRVLLATTELWDRPSKLLRALFLKLRAKTMVFIPMNVLLVDTRGKWCMLSSELHSVRSLRRFPSVGTEYAAVVSRASVAQRRFLHKCQTNLHEKFQRREFHTTEESVYKSSCSSQLIAVRAPPVAMVRVWLWLQLWIKIKTAPRLFNNYGMVANNSEFCPSSIRYYVSMWEQSQMYTTCFSWCSSWPRC